MELLEEDKQIRRLQLSGGSTFIISLPKIWVEDLKIGVGDSVTITKNSNRSMTLYPGSNNISKEKNQAEIITSQQDTGESLSRKIIEHILQVTRQLE